MYDRVLVLRTLLGIKLLEALRYRLFNRVFQVLLDLVKDTLLFFVSDGRDHGELRSIESRHVG